MESDLMATTLTDPRPTTDSTIEPCVLLSDVDWEGYESILKIRGERSTPRMVYLDGSLFLVSPSYSHERLAERLGLLIVAITEELDIPRIGSASTTFRRGSKKGGVEGDKTYYLASEAKVRGKDEIDLEVDPPPDLAVEAVWTHKAEAAVEVYRRLQVPEVWVHDGRNLQILVLQPSGRYDAAESSLALPVSAAEIQEWVARRTEDHDTAWAKAVRRWAREVVAPRVGGPPPA
jgi:Uma2 family endonuclease